MKDIIKEAEDKGLSRADIARIAGVDPSTVRNWWNTGNGSLKPARMLKAHLDNIGSVEPIDQSTDEEQIMKIARWLKEGQNLGICLFGLTNAVK
jgi:transposase-like protein